MLESLARPAPPARLARPARAMALFIAANVLYWMALYLYVPTLSTYVGLRTGDLALVGLVLSMYGLWQTFARLPVGIAVDATGNGKPFIVAGFLFAALGAVTLAASRSVAGLALGRGLTGFAAATWVPLLAIFSGLFPPERAVLAATLLNLSGSVGRLLATSLNGVLNQAGGYGLAFALAAAASLAAVVLVLLLPVDRRPPRRPSLRSVLALAGRRDVVLPTALQTLLVFCEWAVPLSFMPLLAAELGAGDVTKGLLVSVSMAANTLSNVANTWLERRLSPMLLVRLAFGMLVAGVALAAAAPTAAALFTASALMGLGSGLGYPMLVGLMLGRVEQARHNTAAGLHQSVYALGMFGGPWLGGIVAAAAGLRVMFAVVAIGALAASWLLTGLLAAAMRAAAAGPAGPAGPAAAHGR